MRRDRARAALEQARARLGLPVGGDDDALDPHKVGVVPQAKARLEQATVDLNRSRELRDQGIQRWQWPLTRRAAGGSGAGR